MGEYVGCATAGDASQFPLPSILRRSDFSFGSSIQPAASIALGGSIDRIFVTKVAMPLSLTALLGRARTQSDAAAVSTSAHLKTKLGMATSRMTSDDDITTAATLSGSVLTA